MTGPTRIRVLTPEHLDNEAADLVSTTGSALRAAVQSVAGTSGAAPTGVSTATANAIMQRDSNARAQVADPSANLDIVNKQYLKGQTDLLIPTSQKAIAGGLASLDSNSTLQPSQVPTNLGRSLGTGTTLVAARRGDVFFHTGLNCLLMYTGSEWMQVGVAEIATRAARTTLTSTYSPVFPRNYQITQADTGYRWRWTTNGWAYAGYSGQDSRGSSGVGATVGRWFRNNFPVPQAQTPTVTGWTWDAPEPTMQIPEWISYNTNGTFTIKDRATVSVVAQVQSDTTNSGRSDVNLAIFGGDHTITTAGMRSAGQRNVGYPGAGYLIQSVHYSGAVEAGSTCQLLIYQYLSTPATVNYSMQIAFEISPY